MASLICLDPLQGQSVSLRSGGTLIGPGDLPPALDAVLQTLGGRMASADKAQVTLAGTVTDAAGSRAAQIVVQAPGYMAYREGTTRALTFDGSQFKTKSGQITADDERVLESLLAYFPDSVCLQFATGGTWRRLGSHFRTDGAQTANYTGSYWTVYAFSPAKRPGLTAGQALQQEIFVGIDEKTWLISEVRVVTGASPGSQSVTQTQFNNWLQQSGQWYPGQIVRLENGKQVLSFQTTQAGLGAALGAAVFQP